MFMKEGIRLMIMCYGSDNTEFVILQSVIEEHQSYLMHYSK